MFEEQIQKAMFSPQSEKTFIDKILSREDVHAIRDLVKKERLTRSELLELLYLVTGNEAKLVNYDEQDRYLQLKLFVWLRQFIVIIEEMYDYKEMREKEKQPNEDEMKLKFSKLKNGKELLELYLSDTDKTEQLLDNAFVKMEHNAKFLVDLYLNIARTSLSINATGLMQLIKNKFEVQYTQQEPQQQKTGGGFLGFGGKKNG